MYTYGLKDLYGKAVEYVEDNSNKDLVFIPAISGDKYFSQPDDKKVMVFGRSVNGWSMPLFRLTGNSEWFPYGLRWVYESGNFCTDGSGHEPAVNHSKFWQFIRCNLKLHGISQKNFSDYIVWSNLYKISPKDRGNPNNKICQDTYNLMDEILCEELRFYKPQKVWFITEPYNKIFGKWIFWEYNKGVSFKNTRNYINDNDMEAKLFLRPERRKFEDVIKKASWI